MQTWGLFSKFVVLVPKERSQKARWSSSKTNVLPRKLMSGKPSSEVVAQTQYFFSSKALSTRCCISSVILIMLFCPSCNISYGEARRLSSDCPRDAECIDGCCQVLLAPIATNF